MPTISSRGPNALISVQISSVFPVLFRDDPTISIAGTSIMPFTGCRSPSLKTTQLTLADLDVLIVADSAYFPFRHTAFLGSGECLGFLARHIGREVWVSLMNQYFPAHRALQLEPLKRKITDSEYAAAFQLLLELGLENGFVQGDCTEDDRGEWQSR